MRDRINNILRILKYSARTLKRLRSGTADLQNPPGGSSGSGFVSEGKAIYRKKWLVLQNIAGMCYNSSDTMMKGVF